MVPLIGLLSIAISLISLVCFILVLLKLFPEKGAGWGIFGILCGLYAFIWGWQNAERLGIQQTMMIWTGAIIGSIILNILARVAF